MSPPRAAGLLLFAAALAAAASLPSDGFASVNMVDLLWSYAGLTAGNASYARASMRAACSARGFTFIRFAAAPFWAKDLERVYLGNASGFWATTDALVADAAGAGCQLMPSLFWDMFTFADAFGEPAGVVFDELLGPSRARDAMEAFAVAYARRYAASSTIVAFELGNENNLLWDLNETEAQNSICVPCGSPPFRTSADNVSTAAGVAVQVRLASLFAGDFSGMVPDSTEGTALTTNGAYSSLFAELGWGSLAVGVGLVVLIPFLRKLITDREGSPGEPVAEGATPA